MEIWKQYGMLTLCPSPSLHKGFPVEVPELKAVELRNYDALSRVMLKETTPLASKAALDGSKGRVSGFGLAENYPIYPLPR